MFASNALKLFDVIWRVLRIVLCNLRASAWSTRSRRDRVIGLWPFPPSATTFVGVRRFNIMRSVYSTLK